MLNLNSTKFAEEIESLCKKKNLEYIDAIIHWCNQNKLEVEFAASFIKKDAVLRSKVQVEAENLNVLKKSAKLPI